MRRILLFFLIGALTSSAFAGQFFSAQGEKVPGEYIVVFTNDFLAIDVAVPLAFQFRADVDVIWQDAINGALFTGLSEQAAFAVAAIILAIVLSSQPGYSGFHVIGREPTIVQVFLPG